MKQTDLLSPDSEAIPDIAANRNMTGAVNIHTANTPLAHIGIFGLSSGSNHI